MAQTLVIERILEKLITKFPKIFKETFALLIFGPDPQFWKKIIIF